MDSPKKTSVTIKDIARSSGVSVGTVSRVLNRVKNVAPENVAKVESAMRKMGYKKNHSAGLLAMRKTGSSSRSGNVGLVFADSGPEWADHPLISAYTMGVEEACKESGYHPLVEFSNNNAEVPRCVRECKVDGLLIKATRGEPAFIGKLPRNLPVILIGMNEPMASLPQVAPDNQEAGWVATDYLWRRGHRRIGFMCANLLHRMFLARMHGYESFLRERGAFEASLAVVRPQSNDINLPQDTPPDMADAFDEMWEAAGDSKPTAIVVANDWMARGLYDVLSVRGLRVGIDISVLGFDNLGILCSSMSPTLTSYDLGFAEVTKSAAYELFDRIGAPYFLRSKSVRLVSGHLVERESVRSLDQ